ncbi:Lactate 2-monooxygenase [Alicyclobacillus hesperidum URH17-3-68]|nr:Lactate 2-monooxygenase [Alicyclobacillus hesperidum URH17-3-68]
MHARMSPGLTPWSMRYWMRAMSMAVFPEPAAATTMQGPF